MNKLYLISYLLLLLIIGCSKNESIPGDHGAVSALKNKTFFDKVGEVRPYNPNNPYAVKMKECIYADTDDKSCSIKSLPLLGMSKDLITPQDILERTMISHDFLGEAFKQVLNRMPPEMLQMFGSINAVVISDKINPSFFYSTSGAIYLSGHYFWSNTEEYKLLNQVKDYRQDFGSALQFIFDNDYIKNGKSITTRASENVQTYDEMSFNVARLLFHELTHANDFFPRSFYQKQDTDLSKTYRKTAFERYSKSEIASLQLPTPLTSKKLNHLGDILYHGVDATTQDTSTLAEEVVQEFKNDVASDPYGYSTPMEDLAMNAEEALMFYYYNIPRYVVVIKLPMPNFKIPENFDYPILWGEKGRILESKIKNRAIFAVENDLGATISQKVSDKLDQFLPKEIQSNTSWDDLYKL